MSERECQSIQRRVESLLEDQAHDGRVPEDLTEDLMVTGLPVFATAHLTNCSACRRQIDEFIKLRRLLLASPRVVVPVDFDARLRERLQGRTQSGFSFWRFFQSPAMAAVAAVVVISVLAGGVYRNAIQSHRQDAASAVAARASQIDQNVSGALPRSSDNTAGKSADNGINKTTAEAGAVAKNNTGAATIGHFAKLRPRKQSPDGAALGLAATNIPEMTLLLRDGQSGGQVLRVPQVIIGAKQVLPKDSMIKRTAYDPTVF